MILSIDCGSTNHKVALYDERLQMLAACSSPVAYAVREAKRTEFDAEKIWQDTVALINQACARAEVAPGQIKTIAIASQAQTFTLLDRDGHPMLPFISWMDKRARKEFSWTKRRFGDDFHRHCSFPSPAPQMQLTKLLWLKRNRPDLIKEADSVVSLPGFLALRLAGLDCIDDNLAAMSGLYSLAMDDWWPPALEAIGLEREQLGSLVKIATAIPARRACAELNLSPQLRVVFAGNDQTAGAYANAVRSGRLALTLGTALVVYRYAGETHGPYHPGGCWGPYPGGGYYELATRDEGCSAIDWAAGELMPGNEAGFMKEAETAAAGAAYFYPQKMREKSAWTGLADSAARARAVLEGLCFSARGLIENDLKIRPGGDQIVAIGGGSQNRFWLQIFADVLNCPVRRGEGDILLGAAMMALPGVVAPGARGGEAIVPRRAAVENYDKIYRAWLAKSDFRLN